MTRMKRALSLLLVLSLSSSAMAQEYKPAPLVPIPPGDDLILSLKQGEPAPFSGQLFDSKTAVRWANFLEQAKLRLKIDVEAERKKAELGQQAFDQKLELERKRYELVTTDYERRLAQMQAPPSWYEKPAVVFFAGALSAGALVFIAAYALNQATK